MYEILKYAKLKKRILVYSNIVLFITIRFGFLTFSDIEQSTRNVFFFCLKTIFRPENLLQSSTVVSGSKFCPLSALRGSHLFYFPFFNDGLEIGKEKTY